VRLKLALEYDGTAFHGWAAQSGLRTVESAVRTGLDGVFRGWSELAVAGRTDAGVHALGQVVSVEVEVGPPPGRVAEALNAVLPDDVAVLAVEAAPEGFDARNAASSRTYRYRIFRRRTPSPFEHRRSWWLPARIDETRLADSAELLLGEHDFTAFTPSESRHRAFVREVSRAEWHRREDHLDFEITAGSFLRHMVRTLVGTMVDLPPDHIARLLEGRARAEAGQTAPPWGLYLLSVAYD
jgi:tRNA pseudouridine38-40 synthase